MHPAFSHAISKDWSAREEAESKRGRSVETPSLVELLRQHLSAEAGGSVDVGIAPFAYEQEAGTWGGITDESDMLLPLLAWPDYESYFQFEGLEGLYEVGSGFGQRTGS